MPHVMLVRPHACTSEGATSGRVPVATIAPVNMAAYTPPMPSLHRHRLLHVLACLAVALMLVAPLISRWSQARALEPMCMSGPALATGTAVHAGHVPAQAQSAAHPDHSMPGAKQRAGDHDAALHGEACDYCMLAARLLPWLVLCLLQRRPVPMPLPATVRVRSALRWSALGARGPPLYA